MYTQACSLGTPSCTGVYLSTRGLAIDRTEPVALFARFNCSLSAEEIRGVGDGPPTKPTEPTDFQAVGQLQTWTSSHRAAPAEVTKLQADPPGHTLD